MGGRCPKIKISKKTKEYYLDIIGNYISLINEIYHLLVVVLENRNAFSAKKLTHATIFFSTNSVRKFNIYVCKRGFKVEVSDKRS